MVASEAGSGETRGLLAGLLTGVSAEVRRALSDAGAGSPDRVTLGVPDGAKAAVIAALAQDAPGPVLVITARPSGARSLLDDIAAWLPLDTARPLLPFPPREALPYEHRRIDRDAIRARLGVLASLAGGANPLVVADVQALSQRTLRGQTQLLQVRTGERLAVADVLGALDRAGYRRQPLADEPGTFARRGGIIDIYPVSDDRPLRIELFGDEVESLRRFDPVSQRSVERVSEAALPLATEAIVDDEARALAASLGEAAEAMGAGASKSADQTAADLAGDLDRIEAGDLPEALALWGAFLSRGTLLERLPSDTLIVWTESDESRRHAEELDDLAVATREQLERRGEIPAGLPLPHSPADELLPELQGWRPRIDLERFATAEPPGSAPAGPSRRLGFQAADRYGGRLRRLIDALVEMQAQGRRVAIISLQASRLAEMFREYGLAVRHGEALTGEPVAGEITMVRGSAPSGWRLAAADGAGELVLLTDTEIFGFAKQRRAPARSSAKHAGFLDDLQAGDYVVHVEHGIARFVGTVHERVGDREREYLELRYESHDRLLVPTDQLHRLQRYVGPSDRPPTLTRLGTQQWVKAKGRVRAAVKQLAEDLLGLYASRQVVRGLAAEPDTPWQMELEASFPYAETPDQAAAVRDVKADMERARPMDRIVVGDVGYGKTEVAVRAAFKAVASGRQAAMLVPTTVLAQQHYHTFQERLAAFPARVEMLSRFRTPAEQTAILADVERGAVDILIGTHRILQKDVKFKNLGLLIIDEEQRFGVAHKETLKRLRRDVDVLTLSATPIPRTLHMALTGIRDMSTIETAPEERLPISTYVMETDDQVIREAILREVERGGQVYFVHNRVRSIDGIARWLRELVPEARFLVGHGQMREAELERVMGAFVAGEADVLICTTIIESGLDIPNANTIIVHKAQLLGLAQLYQLRGRVGRSAAGAYAYLLYDPHQALTETAQKRLQTVFEATELGAGFQIAQKDLEIRGAGNLLGAEQSGQIGAVGFELFTQLLSEAVEQARARREGRSPEPVRRGPTVSLDLPLVAHIPDSYVDDVNLRLSLYQQLAAVEDAEAADRLGAELHDRFGPPPAPVVALLWAVRLRALAARLGAESVQREEEDDIVVRLVEGITFSDADRRRRMPDGVVVGRRLLRLDMRRRADDWMEALEAALQTLAERPAERSAVGGPSAAGTAGTA